jgi:hypothetical protein
MIRITIICDGCHTTGGSDPIEVTVGFLDDINVLANEAQQEALRYYGWEQTRTREQYCPTCRRARSGTGLVAPDQTAVK